MSNETYVEGYKKCLNDVSKIIGTSTPTTVEDVVDSYNSVVSFLHIAPHQLHQTQAQVPEVPEIVLRIIVENGGH